MKKILLLSDTHGYLDEAMLKHIKQADEVWHAGDIGSIEVTDTIKKYAKLRAVYGNIDGGELRKEFSEIQMFRIEKIKVFMIHIGGYPPNRFSKKARQIIQKYPPTLFISGHSHILKVLFDKKRNMLHMNPGAAGKNGFHKTRTLLRFEIDQKEIKNLAVIELEKR